MAVEGIEMFEEGFPETERPFEIPQPKPRMASADLLKQRVDMVERTGRRLGRVLAELEEIDEDIERLDRVLFLPQLDEELRHRLLGEIDIAVTTYNLLRDAAIGLYRQLVLQREDCGFRDHDVLRRIYRIPELHQLGETDDLAQIIPHTE